MNFVFNSFLYIYISSNSILKLIQFIVVAQLINLVTVVVVCRCALRWDRARARDFPYAQTFGDAIVINSARRERE